MCRRGHLRKSLTTLHRLHSNYHISRNTWSINIKFVVRNCVNNPEGCPQKKQSIGVGENELLVPKKSEKVNDTTNVVKKATVNHT